MELPLYVNFVDYEKAFDNLDRETSWKLLRHYGVPMNFVNLIRNSMRVCLAEWFTRGN